MFKCTDPLNYPGVSHFDWSRWSENLNFKMSTGCQCALTLWLVWANGPAGKQMNARGRSILYVLSFFDVGLVYAPILFAFFCPCRII